MLVLTRKYQEKIRIGDNITITVLRTKGKAVRLGIEAPADVPVIRGELSFETSEADPNAAAIETDVLRLPKRTLPCRGDAASTWATDSPHQVSNRACVPQRPHIEMKRVPRGQVADVLPKLVSGSAPLRAMMDQR
jgi:carbon storage regulator